MSLNPIQKAMAERLVYRVAAADFLRACRELHQTAQRLAAAARAWDPMGEKQDPVVLGIVEDAGMILAATAGTSPGVHGLFAEAAAGAPSPDSSAPAAPQE